eukprot:gnl/Spiro4/14743_TR7942_c0_g1_i1.p1 gnl/Spiro4/14743_TR7942_c0_g1~~gnl/Spiro4/14743_TR7942_c0_g1_i1.p1  ORF type:complete len:214 (-),score=66.41 gnl/Spiro4/14743_TR7942_c0_g1_i1:105-746(-)
MHGALKTFRAFDETVLTHKIRQLELGLLDYPLALVGMMFTRATSVISMYTIGAVMSNHSYPLFFSLLLLTALANFLLKSFFRRPRPQADASLARRVNVRVAITGGLSEQESFPSGDVCMASCYFTALALLHEDNRLLLAVVPVMFARVYFLCHWVTDTLFGWLIGACVSLVCVSYFAHIGWGATATAALLYAAATYTLSGSLNPTNTFRPPPQ